MSDVIHEFNKDADVDENKESLFITFHSEDEIISFVKLCNQFDDAIDINVEGYKTDAKSIIGMLLLSLDKPLQLWYGCYDEEDNYSDFKKVILEQFQVEAKKKESKGESNE